jgi:hypothetical protein
MNEKKSNDALGMEEFVKGLGIEFNIEGLASGDLTNEILKKAVEEVNKENQESLKNDLKERIIKWQDRVKKVLQCDKEYMKARVEKLKEIKAEAKAIQELKDSIDE